LLIEKYNTEREREREREREKEKRRQMLYRDENKRLLK